MRTGDAIIWEHGRRNFALRAEGVLSIVCPITDESDIAGLAIFNANVERTNEIMEDYPAIKAEILSYEGTSLPQFSRRLPSSLIHFKLLNLRQKKLLEHP